MFAGLGNSGLGKSKWVTLLIDGITTSYVGGWRLWEFNLEDMNLTELHAGVFDGLEHLWKLSLKGKQIENAPGRPFFGTSVACRSLTCRAIA